METVFTLPPQEKAAITSFLTRSSTCVFSWNRSCPGSGIQKKLQILPLKMKFQPQQKTWQKARWYGWCFRDLANSSWAWVASKSHYFRYGFTRHPQVMNLHPYEIHILNPKNPAIEKSNWPPSGEVMKPPSIHLETSHPSINMLIFQGCWGLIDLRWLAA